ncbi:MAG TPA: hypothetical protein DCM05_06175 [Elusimicrobia bacterium]|nr:hypothetical protein [Elusimicrobiota bacterium]
MSFRERAAPLVLLGTLGMVLSEGGVWNVQGLYSICVSRPAAVVPALLFCQLLYVCVFAVFADILHRWKVADAFGLLLLGSVYGLLMEGVFADKVFIPSGLGPPVFGLHLIRLTFTGLSAHPLLPFLGGFLLFKAVHRGEMGLARPGFEERELGRWAAVCLAWFSVAFAAIHLRFFGGPVPAALQAFLLGWVGLMLWLALRASTGGASAAPEEVLPGIALPLFWLPVAAGLFFRGRSLAAQGRLDAFLFYLAIVAFYALLFALHVRGRKTVPERSVYGEAFPAAAQFSGAKLAKLALSAFALLALLRGGAWALNLQRPLAALCLLAFLGCVVFSAVFPVYALARLVRGR